MNPRLLFFAVLSWMFALGSACADELNYFELRTYHTNPGKLDALHARFRDHTVELFKKHGMTNIAYWVPKDNEEQVLVYLLGYPDKEAREASWKAFHDDPAWKDAYAESTKDGKLITKVDNVFLEKTEYSPALPFTDSEQERLFEMRRYTTNEGKLDDLDARFRDHTIELFKKHGMTNLAYFHLAEGQEGNENTLLYFLAHESEDARNTSFKAFSQDPEWKAARDESEKDGKLLVKKGVQSTFLLPTDYSPVK